MADAGGRTEVDSRSGLAMHGLIFGELKKYVETIHRVVRSQNPGADPPQLRCTRVGPEEVVISYASPRKMCGVAKGITRGIAKRLAETVVISESVCMLRGGPTCEISVRLNPID